MQVYVAGKTQAVVEVRQVQELVRATGHTVSYDWTEVIIREGGDSNEVDIPQERRTKYAQNDMSAVYVADLLIALGHPHLSGTIWECGMGAITGSRVWLVDWERYGRRSIFEDLPNVERVEYPALLDRLWEISPRRLEQEMPHYTISPEGFMIKQPWR